MPDQFRRWRVSAAIIVPALAVATWFLTRPAAVALVRTADQNILLITLDTVRGDALGCYGGTARTPHLDALAAEGLRFEFAHAHAVMTLPSHASILTGLYPFAHGVRDNSGFRLPPETRTLATHLKAARFATAAYISAYPLDSQFGLDTGFDVYNDRVGEARGPAEFSFPERRAESTVAAARDWIAQQTGRWFVWIHLFDPHAPYAPPAPFQQEYAANAYAGEIAYVDSALEPLLNQVGGGTRPTTVIVTADHGEGLGEHGETTHGLFAYETTLRVPLILAQQGGTAQRRGQTTALPAQHVDIVPTVLDLVGIVPPAGLPGRSLIDARADAERASYFEALSASLNRGWAPLRGVLHGRDKYIDLPIPELYDLAVDPAEQQSRAAERADRVRQLQARLQMFGNLEAGPRRAETADVQSRLRALGYVTGDAAPKARYTESDDPKRLVELDRALHQAVELTEQGRADEARVVYQRILTERPDMAIAYRHLAFVQWASGDPRGAVDTLRDAMAKGLGDASMRTQLGTYLAEAGAEREAIALLEPVDVLSADADTVNALGIAYARAGRSADALRTFEAVLARGPNATALQNMGSVYLATGENTRARDVLERAVSLESRAAPAWTGLGVAHLRLGDRDAAVTSWRHAVAADPREFNALYNLAIELHGRGDPEGRRLLERFVQTAPPAFYAADIAHIRRLLSGSGAARP